MEAHLSPISLTNAKVNAIVTLVPEETLLVQADDAVHVAEAESAPLWRGTTPT